MKSSCLFVDCFSYKSEISFNVNSLSNVQFKFIYKYYYYVATVYKSSWDVYNPPRFYTTKKRKLDNLNLFTNYVNTDHELIRPMTVKSNNLE